MMSRSFRFNTYLLLPALTLALAGCKTPEQRKHDRAISSFRLYLEDDSVGTERTADIEIAGVELRVSNSPFLDESSVANAAVVDTKPAGFAMRVQLDRHGTLVLDTVTTEHRGRHLAFFSQFGPGKLTQKRWLAAPYIGASITDGVLLFTPLASREEAEQIVEGINNVAKKIQKRNKF